MDGYVYTTDTGDHFLHAKKGDLFSVELLNANLKKTGLRFSFSHAYYDLTEGNNQILLP